MFLFIFHKLFQCLFVWDLVSGLYKTEHVSFKEDPTQDSFRGNCECSVKLIQQ